MTTSVEHLDLAGQAGGDSSVVGDDHDGGPSEMQFVDQCQDRLPGDAVEIAGGLVGQDDGRSPDQRPGDGYPLALATRQLGGPRPGCDA